MLIVFFALVSRQAVAAEIPLPAGLCDERGLCSTLKGEVGMPGGPGLAQLVQDIIEVFDAPQWAWVRAADRPPEDLTLDLADELRACFAKAIALQKTIVPHCVGSRAPTDLKIVPAFVDWSPERERLMQQYLEMHTENASTRLEEPELVVTHWTGSPTARSAIETFKHIRIAAREAKVLRAGSVNVSCHFVVDRDGTIYQLLPEDKIARHTIGLNRKSFCIENVGGPNQQPPLTLAQASANAQLIEFLKWKHPSLSAALGHFEYRNFEGTYLFREKDNGYRTGKDDPGKEFMSVLRKDLSSRCTKAAKH